MFDFLRDLWNSFIDTLLAIFEALAQLLMDIALNVFELLLSGFKTIFASIPVPDFLSNGISGMINGIDPSVIYFLSVTGFGDALAILGTGFGFRMTRKALTLGQW